MTLLELIQRRSTSWSVRMTMKRSCSGASG